MNVGLRQLAELPEAFLRVNYEELVRDPAVVLSRILAFIGVADDPALIEYAREVLSAPKPRPQAELHASLRAPFAAALARMGYPAAS